MPARQCVRLPDEIADDEAALIETTEVAVRAVRKAGVRLGDSVAIVGDGAVGLITLQVARAAGATTVILLGHRAARLEIGRRLGADAAIDTHDPGWLDAVADLTGRAGRRRGDRVRRAGRGDRRLDRGDPEGRPDRPARRHRRRRSRSTRGRSSRASGPSSGASSTTSTRTSRSPCDLLASGRVDVRPLITRRISLERVVDDGFAAPPSAGDIKVLVSTRPEAGEA